MTSYISVWVNFKSKHGHGKKCSQHVLAFCLVASMCNFVSFAIAHSINSININEVQTDPRSNSLHNIISENQEYR